MRTELPNLFLWGDMLGQGKKARLWRRILPCLLDAFPTVEARNFWPSPRDEPEEGRPFPLGSGSRYWTVKSQACDSELELIKRAVAGTVPLGSTVLALAEATEDPTAQILADIPEAGEILLLDPSEQGIDADRLTQHILKQLASRRTEEVIEVLMTAAVLGPSGYAADGRALFMALERRADIRVCLRPLRFGRVQSPEDPSFLKLVKTASERTPNGEYLALHVLFPQMFKPDANAKANILRTTYETDSVPQAWIPSLRAADEIWLPSAFNLRSFQKAGISASRLRVIPECLDEELFDPARHPQRESASGEASSGPTVFLSIFDWCERKSPELLLRCFGTCFAQGEAILRLKVHSSLGRPIIELERIARTCVETAAAQAGHAAPQLQWIKDFVAPSKMPELYAQADAFVLPSRGEGWGRPVHEAMAMGLPVIATSYGGTQDLLSGKAVALVIAGREVPCSAKAISENPCICGHRDFEADRDELCRLLREVAQAKDRHRALGSRARRHVLRNFATSLIAEKAATALRELRAGTARSSLFVGPGPERTRPSLLLDGPIFASSSYGGITRQLCRALARRDKIRVHLRADGPAERDSRQDADLLRYFDETKQRPDFCLRSGWPIKSMVPDAGYWIQRFDWEYGPPPKTEASLLCHGPDEIWVHSRHVEEGLLSAGIPKKKIWRIPHGIDPVLFRPGLAPLASIEERCAGDYRFLFVGGTIWRKGADLLLSSWCSSFTRDDRVCLIVRAAGASGSYAGQGLLELFKRAAANPLAPKILLLEDDLSDHEMGSLYACADCLIHPYRGEGFGMPILEAMACGLPIITTRGGASDDFVDESSALLLPADPVRVEIDQVCTSHPWVMNPRPGSVERAMRQAFSAGPGLRERAALVADRVLLERTWDKVAASVEKRLLARFQRIGSPWDAESLLDQQAWHNAERQTRAAAVQTL